MVCASPVIKAHNHAALCAALQEALGTCCKGPLQGGRVHARWRQVVPVWGGGGTVHQCSVALVCKPQRLQRSTMHQHMSCNGGRVLHWCICMCPKHTAL